jgi:hypothetical protein
MRVPKLPFSLQAEEYITNQVDLWRSLELLLPVDPEKMKLLPDSFYYRCDQSYMLSEYGEMVWLNLKPTIYSEKIYPSPSPKVRFGSKFAESVKNLESGRLLILNRRIDELVRYLESPKQDMLKALSFKAIKKRPRVLLPMNSTLGAIRMPDACIATMTLMAP